MTAFRSFFKTKELRGIKAHIRFLEEKSIQHRSKKVCLDHLSCDGVAAFTRAMWIIDNTTRNLDGNKYNWSKGHLSEAMSYYNSHQITAATFRRIARSDPWRSMWSIGKKQSIFKKGVKTLGLALVAGAGIYASTHSTDKEHTNH